MTIGWPQIIGGIVGCAFLAAIIAYVLVTKNVSKDPPPDHWTDHFDSKRAHK